MMILTLGFSMDTLPRLLAADGLATVQTASLIMWACALNVIGVTVKTADGGVLGSSMVAALREAVHAEINLRVPERK